MSDSLDLPKRPHAVARTTGRALLLVLGSTLALTSACFDAGGPPTAPDSASLSVVSRIECVGSTVARSVACAPGVASNVIVEDRQSATRYLAPAALRSLVLGAVGGPIILGNQAGYVKLASSNVSVAGGVFSFDVTLQNLIPQPIGTTDGFSADAAGSKVFFESGPTLTSGTGAIDFVNGGGFFYDNVGDFTGTNQPYFQYVALLNTGDSSTAKTWKLRFDPGVVKFSFSVFVSTPVKFPNGYVDGNPSVLTLNPAEQSSLGGTVRTAVGNSTSGTIAYSSNASGIASVNASGVVTAGASNGLAFVSLSSGAKPGYLSTAVNVCASTPTLTSGASVMGTIDASDCLSSFANAGRPDPSFQSDMFRIAVTAGQQIGITMTSDGSFVPCLTLADPDGVRVSYNCDPTSATILAGAPMPRTGIYTIEAGQFDPFDAGLTGAYTLGVTILP